MKSNSPFIRIRKTRVPLSAIFAIMLAIVLSGCPGGSKQGDLPQDFDKSKPQKGDWVVVHDLSDPEGLNPVTTSDASASNIFKKIFEPLLDIDFATTDLRPNLATARPTLSDDHLTYTFTLHTNITFSDGKPLTANDVVFTFKAVKNPLIVEAASQRNYMEDLADVSAIDDHTVKFTMRRPYFMAEYAIGNNLGILPKHIFDPKGLTNNYTFAETDNFEKAKSNAAMQEFATWFSRPECKRDVNMIIGSGPYILEAWNTGQDVRIRRNEKYWNAGNNPNMVQYPDKIIYKTVSERQTAVVEVKNSDIDFMEYVPPKLFVNSIDTNKIKGVAKNEFVSSIYTYIGWNTRRPMFSDYRVRQALSHLVDRNKIIQTIMLGFAKPLNGPVYPDRPEYDKTLTSYEFSPEKARQLLTDAGWRDSDGDGRLDKVINGKKTDFAFSMTVNVGNEIRENIALLLSDELKKLGIIMTVNRTDWSVMLQSLRTSEFDSYIGSWVNDPIPTDPYQLWHSSQAGNQGSNYCGFINKRADQLIEMNRVEFDETKRIALMKEFQQIVHDEQPYTFLWNVVSPVAYTKRLQNVKLYTARPGYNPTEWWVPKQFRKYDKN